MALTDARYRPWLIWGGVGILLVLLFTTGFGNSQLQAVNGCLGNTLPTRGFIEQTALGIVLGFLYAIAALGFVLIYKASGVVNFAQGQFLMVGGFLAIDLLLGEKSFFLGLPGLSALRGPFNELPLWSRFIVGFILASVLMILLGFLIERTVLRPLIGEQTISVVMATIGLASILQAVPLMIWGTSPFPFPDVIGKEPVRIFDIPIGRVNLVAAAFAIVFMVGFGIFFKRTRTGIAMQAVADDQLAASSMGISVRWVFAISWAIAAFVAMVGGVAWGAINGVDQNLAGIGLLVFPVVILGGLDSIIGAIVGGLAVGVLTTLSGGYVEPCVKQQFSDITAISNVAPYMFLIIVLMIKPYGLFGREIIRRV